MTTPVKTNFKIYQGSTFTEVLRYESYNKIYKTITDITKTAPVVITATAHNMPIGWRFKVSNVIGMKEINTDDYLLATSVTTNTVTVNSVNAVGYTTYTSGGIITYNEPKSLSGITARMQIRLKISSPTIILELTNSNGMIQLDDTLKTITINIPAATTTLFTFKSAVYSLELVEGSVVIPIIYGNLTLDNEITR